MILVAGVPVHVKISEAVNMTALNVSIERCANCGHYLEEEDYIAGLVKFNWWRIIGYSCICGYMEEI